MASFSVTRQETAPDEPLWYVVEFGERVAAVFLLAAASPLLAASAAALAIASGRSPLIAHRRVGWRGETLWMLKLRTMWEPGGRKGAGWIEYIDQGAGYQQKQAGDARVGNRFAGFCRRHSIDEIPQLWHVIRGRMSLVGPRPMTAVEFREHYGSDTGEVLRVRPGLAGLWQISGRNRLSYAERCALDLQWVRSRTFRMYARILLRTLPEVWRGANTW